MMRPGKRFAWIQYEGDKMVNLSTLCSCDYAMFGTFEMGATSFEPYTMHGPPPPH